SLALWHFLARRLRELPMLLVATLRSDGQETGEFSSTRMRGLSAAVETHVLDLGPLAPDAHHELLRQRSGRGSLPRARADEVFKLSEGNPMYALELHDFRGGQSIGNAATDGLGEGTIPPSLRLSVAERLKGLSTPARELLTLASVWGGGLPYPFLKILWPDRGEGESGLLDLIDQLTAARLLDERGIQYHFRHALYRSCVYESASGARRQALHARVARVLVQAGEREDDLAVEQIAFHYLITYMSKLSPGGPDIQSPPSSPCLMGGFVTQPAPHKKLLRWVGNADAAPTWYGLENMNGYGYARGIGMCERRLR
ncbi:MAG: hypothetical protein U9R74_08355, partial [Pseudomonadota bacterium]|nr:hypothetical protein [Pseudomonadota bacterium]